MKVKLLKKIRKRYSITLYTKIGNPDSWLAKHPLPFYLIEDNDDGYGLNTKIKPTYKEAYEYLQALIHAHYHYKIKKYTNSSEKIWYKIK